MQRGEQGAAEDGETDDDPARSSGRLQGGDPAPGLGLRGGEGDEERGGADRVHDHQEGDQGVGEGGDVHRGRGRVGA